MLLYGPPGTGKTLLARALANNIEASYLKVVASAIVDKYIGESARIIREMFGYAKEHQPCGMCGVRPSFHLISSHLISLYHYIYHSPTDIIDSAISYIADQLISYYCFVASIHRSVFQKTSFMTINQSIEARVKKWDSNAGSAVGVQSGGDKRKR